MHSLAEQPTPTVTTPARALALPRSVALYTLALSITAGSTAAYSDYSKDLNLKHAAIYGPNTTNATSLEPLVPVVTAKPSWLESTIDALLGDFPEEEWANVPDIFVADVDRRM